MKKYLDLLREVLETGQERFDRTEIGTYALFGKSLSWDLQEGFPAVTTKKLYFNSVAAELAGFLEGTESAARMRELGTHIWDANANAPWWQKNPLCKGKDDMGKIYGSLWRDFHGVDQLHHILYLIRERPADRRMVVSAWDPSNNIQCLPPCHIFFQVYVRNAEYLDCQMYMRSVDMFLGFPFDVASYALLVHILAQQSMLKPGKLTLLLGDTHIYRNHIEQVKIQLRREPYPSPTLNLWDGATIDNFMPEMVYLENYQYYPTIKAPMAV